MDKLISTLKELVNEYDVEKLYNWEIPEDSPLKFTSDLNTSSSFEENIYLKHKLAPYLHSKNLNNRYWIIQKWGGISSFKPTAKNDELLLRLDLELAVKKMTRPTFDVIPSTSKVASFLDHKNYAIYDSRVIYALNWLLFKHASATEFYPQPSGRNKDLARFELNTIFNLAGREVSYKNYQTAYFDFCDLMKFLSKEIYGKGEPYWAEMLLFSIAPTYIVEDIKSSCRIEFK